MNVKRYARVAIALASCTLITAPVVQASVPHEAGSYSQIQGDDHARTTSATVVTPIVAVGDDHARSASATVAVATPTFTKGDDHAVSTPATVAVATPGFTKGDDHARSTAAVAFPPHGSFPVPSDQTSSAQIAASASGGFDWEDAGVGFGTAAGIALLAGGLMMSTRKLRGLRTSSV